MTQALLSRLDRDYCIRVLQNLIAINSIVGREGAVADYLRTELEDLGLACELQEVEPGRSNVYAWLQGSGRGRRLNFNGHTDTVPVCEGWTHDPFTPVIQDGRLYGLGACDMKGGIACILAMLKAFVESGHRFRGELSFSGVIDEEAYSKGARAMMDTDLANCDAIVLAEPYSGDAEMPIPLGITGKVLYDLTVRGYAAHGFHPERGVNAVEEAARIVSALGRLRLREHPEFGRGNTCTLKLEGGYQIYSVVVPDVCHVEINRLLVPGETAASAVEDMQELVRSLQLKAQVEVGLKPPRYDPFVVGRDQPIIQLFHSVYREMTGAEPVYVYGPGITDANVFGERGIPCLHLGPARGNVHQPDEYVSLDWLERLPRMYALIAARFLDGES
jgi:acetylornithine deacetylase/succinyl-diaminopimelate desuccinylase-like protein